MLTVFFWIGGREAGEWQEVATRLRGRGVRGRAHRAAAATRLARAGYVSRVAENKPAGPPADASFKALGL